MRDVQIEIVVAAPVERLAARHHLDAFGIDAARAEIVDELGREIVADHSDQLDGREERGGDGGVVGCAAQRVFHFAGRRLDVVERHRSDDYDWRIGHNLVGRGEQN